MPVALGYEAYVAIGMQTAFGTPVTPGTTYAHLRSGSPISPQTQVNPRLSTASIMPKASQVWQTVDLCPWSYEFELNSHASAWAMLIGAATGKRVKTVGAPDTDVCTIVNPPVDGGTDTATDFYNHSLTMRQTLTGVATYEVREACISKMVLTFPRNDTLKLMIEGTGQNLQTASPVSYVDIAGTTYNWAHVISSANGGLQAGSANPPTSSNQMIMKSAIITLDNNLIFEAQMGGAAGNDLRLPTRNDFPTLEVALDGWFTDTEATDAVTIMSSFLAATADNFRVKAYIDANNALEFLASAATRPVFWDAPRINVNGPGPVGFQVVGRVFPEAIATDAKFTWTSP